MMQTVFDILRKTQVLLTPEEKVRQWFIAVLKDNCKVPLSHMMSEVSFKYGDKVFRADILLWDKDLQRLAIVECKRSEVELTPKVLDQALCYNLALDVKWIFLTNGRKTFAFRRSGDGFQTVNYLPDYEQMLS